MTSRRPLRDWRRWRAGCCNVKRRPPGRAMRTGGCCCWAGCYGWRRPRTKLREREREVPLPTPRPRLRHGPPATHGGHWHGRGRGAHAEVQLHGHHGQGRPHLGVSEAARLPAQPGWLRLLPGHDQLVSSRMRGPVVGRRHDANLDRVDELTLKIQKTMEANTHTHAQTHARTHVRLLCCNSTIPSRKMAAVCNVTPDDRVGGASGSETVKLSPDREL